MWFGKPPMRMKAGYDEQNNPHAHLSRWVQAYGAQPAQTHTILAIGNMINKQERARRWCDRWLGSMIRPSTPKIICVEAFNKLCEVLNTIHHVKHTDWDLCVPAVLWTYRTMCKTLTMRALPKLKYEADAAIPMEHAKPSSCTVAPMDMMVHEARKGGIT